MKENKFVDKIVEINFEKEYSESDSDILKKEIRATSMDEKWNIIFEKNILSFYRSWTGRGIFKIKFVQHKDQLIVEKAFVEEAFGNQEGKDYCSDLLHWIIEVVIFRRNADYPEK